MGNFIPNSLRPCQRRTFGATSPRQQIRLAVTVLGITGLFMALAAGNSYAAYSSMLNTAVSMTPESWVDDVIAQTRIYTVVSSTLAVGYFLAIIGASVAFVHRVVGPLVALRRHVHELERGRYRSRVNLRGGGGGVLAEFADQLNDLAATLEDRERESEAA